MPRYYCDYCDTYLTHDSPSVRKQHNAGYKHKANVRTYYQQFEEQQTQSFIDQKVKEHQHMAASYHYKPMVGMPRPGMGLPGSSPAPMLRPPVMGGPPAGYNPSGGFRPPVAPLPGNSQANGVYRPGPPGAGGPPPGGPRPASSNGVPPGGYPQSGYPGYGYGGPGPNYGSNQPPLPPPPPRPGTSSGYAYSQPPAAGSGDSPAGYRS